MKICNSILLSVFLSLSACGDSVEFAGGKKYEGVELVKIESSQATFVVEGELKTIPLSTIRRLVVERGESGKGVSRSVEVEEPTILEKDEATITIEPEELVPKLLDLGDGYHEMQLGKFDYTDDSFLKEFRQLLKDNPTAKSIGLQCIHRGEDTYERTVKMAYHRDRKLLVYMSTDNVTRQLRWSLWGRALPKHFSERIPFKEGAIGGTGLRETYGVGSKELERALPNAPKMISLDNQTNDAR